MTDEQDLRLRAPPVVESQQNSSNWRRASTSASTSPTTILSLFLQFSKIYLYLELLPIFEYCFKEKKYTFWGTIFSLQRKRPRISVKGDKKTSQKQAQMRIAQRGLTYIVETE